MTGRAVMVAYTSARVWRAQADFFRLAAALTCRRIPSSEQFAGTPLAFAVDQDNNGLMRGLALVNPDSPLPFEKSFGPDGSKHDFTAFAFELEGIARAEMEFLP